LHQRGDRAGALAEYRRSQSSRPIRVLSPISAMRCVTSATPRRLRPATAAPCRSSRTIHKPTTILA
jgi:hypothetical protein